LVEEEGLVREVRKRRTDAPPEAVFQAVCALGGDQGWGALDWAWRFRGDVDALFGGPGGRRGRRHPEVLRVGEALDFWRVEVLERPRILRLRAEMKVPGRAW